jgi:enoyl-CoA hydratase/carnithine racemase
MNNPKFKNYSLVRSGIPVLRFQTTSIQHHSTSTMSQPNFTTPPPKVSDTILLSFPKPTILLVTLNRPKSLNCISSAGHHELDSVFRWLDSEPSLRCGVITGTGRAFCAGADLKEWEGQNASKKARTMPSSGFGGLSRRGGRKPVIAAVNGICFGGGCEMVVNTDMVVASEKATFALPEVKRGVVALAGALPRLVRTVGKQRAMEMALTGRTLDAREAERWGLVNRVVGSGGEGADSEVVKEAVRMAEMIAENSPDSVIVSREGIKLGWEGVGAEEGTRLLDENWYQKMNGAENMTEGLRAFVEKRKPRWVPSKL